MERADSSGLLNVDKNRRKKAACNFAAFFLTFVRAHAT